VAAQLATEITPAALILQSTFTSLPDVAQEMLPFLYVKPFIRGEKASPPLPLPGEYG